MNGIRSVADTAPFTPMSSELQDKISKNLTKVLGPEYASTRSGPGGTRMTYLEGHKAVTLANEIFGFNGWSNRIMDVNIDFFDAQDGKYSVGVSAVVRVSLSDGTFHEDIGYGSIENARTKIAAFEKAKKEAVTDAMKRALRIFGNSLGGCFYDKEYLKQIARIKAPPSKQLNEDDLYRAPHCRNQNIESRNFRSEFGPIVKDDTLPNSTSTVHNPQNQNNPSGSFSSNAVNNGTIHSNSTNGFKTSINMNNPNVTSAQRSDAASKILINEGSFYEEEMILAADLESIDVSLLCDMPLNSPANSRISSFPKPNENQSNRHGDMKSHLSEPKQQGDSIARNSSPPNISGFNNQGSNLQIPNNLHPNKLKQNENLLYPHQRDSKQSFVSYHQQQQHPPSFINKPTENFKTNPNLNNTSYNNNNMHFKQSYPNANIQHAPLYQNNPNMMKPNNGEMNNSDNNTNPQMQLTNSTPNVQGYYQGDINQMKQVQPTSFTEGPQFAKRPRQD